MRAIKLGVLCTAITLIALVAVACQGAPAAPTQAPAAPTKAAAAAPTQAPAAPTQAAAAPAATQASAPTAAQAAPSAATAVTSAAETIKIGISQALSGPTSKIGISGEHFIKMALDDVNAKGGVKVGGKTYKFDSVSADDQNNAEAGRAAANKLVLQEKVKFIMGLGTPVVPATQPISEPNKVILMAVGGPAPSFSANFPYSFLIQAHTSMRISALYDAFVKEQPTLKRVAFVSSDDVGGHDAAKLAEAKAKAVGLDMVAQEFYPTDMKDFNPLATRVLRQNPEAVDLGPSAAKPAYVVGAYKALYDQGFRGPVMAISSDIAPMRDNAALMEGFTVSILIDWRSAPLTAGEKDVINRYIQRFGEPDMELAVFSIASAPMILAQAMEKAGTVDDTDKISKVLQENQFDAVFGKTKFVGAKTFGKPTAMEQPIYMTKVKGGQVLTTGVATGTAP